jgi:hypothetical protein
MKMNIANPWGHGHHLNNEEEKANESGESATRLELEQHTLRTLGNQLPENEILRRNTLTLDEIGMGEKKLRDQLCISPFNSLPSYATFCGKWIIRWSR